MIFRYQHIRTYHFDCLPLLLLFFNISIIHIYYIKKVTAVGDSFDIPGTPEGVPIMA